MIIRNGFQGFFKQYFYAEGYFLFCKQQISMTAAYLFRLQYMIYHLLFFAFGMRESVLEQSVSLQMCTTLCKIPEKGRFILRYVIVMPVFPRI